MFFRTGQGTVWPLCADCNTRHKETLARLVEHKAIDTRLAFEAKFDISLDDPQTLERFQQQDPNRVSSAIAQADTKLLSRLSLLS